MAKSQRKKNVRGAPHRTKPDNAKKQKNKKLLEIDEEIDEECAFTEEDVQLRAMFENPREEEEEAGSDGERSLDDHSPEDDSSDGEGVMNLSDMLESANSGASSYLRGSTANEEKLLRGSERTEGDNDEYESSEESELSWDQMDQMDSGAEDADINDKALKKIHKAATGRVLLKRDKVSRELAVSKTEDTNMVAPSHQKTTVAELLGALASKPQFGDIKKKLDRTEKEGPLVPSLHEHQADRIERDVAYDQSSQTVSRWQSLVKKNREAPYVKFPMNAPPRQTPSTAGLASTFQAQNDAELEVDRILKASGMLDEKRTEQNEDLEMNTLTKEEVQARRNELARMKSLLFYHEKKMKRINKIKSKKYRKVMKRQREREQEEVATQRAADDPDSAMQLAMDLQRRRAEERMSLRHKNTSKWVKRQIQKGTGRFDEGTRQAIHEQLAIGEKLKKKQQASGLLPTDRMHSGDEGDDSSLEIDGGDLEDMLAREKAELEQGPEAGKKGGLFGMKFMQRAMEERKDAAKELLNELEKEERAGGESDLDQAGEEAQAAPSTGRRVFDGERAKEQASHAEQPNEAPDDDDRRGDSDEEDTQWLEDQVENERHRAEEAQNAERGLQDVDLTGATVPRPGHRTTLSGRLRVDTTTAPAPPDSEEAMPERAVPAEEAPQVTESAAEVQKPEHGRRRGAVERAAELPRHENPWLQPVGNEDKRKKAAMATTAREDRKSAAKASVQIDELDDADRSNAYRSARQAARVKGKELVRAAFAGAGAEEEDFVREKQEEVTSKLPSASDVGAVVLPGWGSWGGTGARPSRGQKRRATDAAETLQKAKEAAIKKRRDSAPELSHVILSGKRVKQLAALTVSNVPFPYKSKEQYETSLAVPLGRDWVPPSAYERGIRPQVETKMGAMIAPIKFGGKKGRIRDAQRKPLTG